jgi:hypothetical protein
MGHSSVQLLCQGVYQVGAGYGEGCNDADQLRMDPALRLAFVKEHDFAASQPTLCRFENEVLATDQDSKPRKRYLSSYRTPNDIQLPFLGQNAVLLAADYIEKMGEWKRKKLRSRSRRGRCHDSNMTVPWGMW